MMIYLGVLRDHRAVLAEDRDEAPDGGEQGGGHVGGWAHAEEGSQLSPHSVLHHQSALQAPRVVRALHQTGQDVHHQRVALRLQYLKETSQHI